MKKHFRCLHFYLLYVYSFSFFRCSSLYCAAFAGRFCTLPKPAWHLKLNAWSASGCFPMPETKPCSKPQHHLSGLGRSNTFAMCFAGVKAETVYLWTSSSNKMVCLYLRWWWNRQFEDACGRWLLGASSLLVESE